jgi:predicted ATPase
MGDKLDTLTVQGFKSIKSLEDFKLHDLNILIGANGSGKSNFIDVFRMLRAMMELSLPKLPSSSLGAFIESQGGIDDLLFNGPKETSIMSLVQ